MRNCILLFIFFLTITVSSAQLKTNLPLSTITEITIDPFQYQQEKNQFYIEAKVPIPVSDDGPFITYSVSWEILNADGGIEQILYHDAEMLKQLPLNHHIEKNSDLQHTELIYLNSNREELKLKIVTTGQPEMKLKIHFFNPGYTTPNENLIPPTKNVQTQTCPCPQPSVMTRNEWCPNGDCPVNPSPTTTIASHLIIHHSAGVNTSSDWSAVVRSIWNYHVNTLGWSDIGYNWLVDANGKLYEGRGKDQQGAHFCGTNSATAGICLLGTFTSETPQAATLTTLKEMLAWYTCVDDIDPVGISNHSGSGLNLNHISGHRDGCATACPGDAFFPSIAGIRTEVADYVEQVCGGAGLPDVFVEALDFSPNTVYTGETTTLSTTVTNQGALIAENINVHLSLNGNLLASNVISNLEPGESAMFSNAYVFQETGMTDFCVMVDPVNNEVEIENNNSCLQIEVESIVNVKDFSNSTLSLFPNPNTGHFFLKNQSNEKGALTIYNAIGQIVLHTKVLGQQQQSFNLSQYSKGVYFVKVETGENVYTGKLLIE